MSNTIEEETQGEQLEELHSLTIQEGAAGEEAEPSHSSREEDNDENTTGDEADEEQRRRNKKERKERHKEKKREKKAKKKAEKEEREKRKPGRPKKKEGESKVSGIRLRRYCFTWHSTVHEGIQDFPDIPPFLAVNFLVYQVETCEQPPHRLHYQGYVEFRSSVRFEQFQKWLPKAHIEVCSANAQHNIDYCTKLPGPSGYGGRALGFEPVKKGFPSLDQASKGEEVALLIKKGATTAYIDQKFPGYVFQNLRKIQDYQRLQQTFNYVSPGYRNVHVEVWWGPPGVGKTYKAQSLYYGKMCIITKQDGQWWDCYEGQEVLLFDDFTDWKSPVEMLSVLEGYDFSLPTKGKFNEFGPRWTHVIITSNLHPNEWWGRERREKTIAQETFDAVMSRIRQENIHYITGENRRLERLATSMAAEPMPLEKIPEFFRRGRTSSEP